MNDAQKTWSKQHTNYNSYSTVKTNDNHNTLTTRQYCITINGNVNKTHSEKFGRHVQ